MILVGSLTWLHREEDNAEDEAVAEQLNEELRDIVQRVSRSYALLLLGSIDGKSTASIANMHREEQRFMVSFANRVAHRTARPCAT
jgi:hypothetical protein